MHPCFGDEVLRFRVEYLVPSCTGRICSPWRFSSPNTTQLLLDGIPEGRGQGLCMYVKRTFGSQGGVLSASEKGLGRRGPLPCPLIERVREKG